MCLVAITCVCMLAVAVLLITHCGCYCRHIVLVQSGGFPHCIVLSVYVQCCCFESYAVFLSVLVYMHV